MLKPPVDAEIYEKIAAVCSPEFAFSYLVKAAQVGKTITPHTVVAWTRLTENTHAMRALRENGYSLRKPEPWSEFRDRPVEFGRAA